MESFFIQGEKSQLYSVYHPPQGDVCSNNGVIICYPFGQEYIRCHRMVKILSEKLSNQGNHVLRFDFSGCGDSEGELENCTIDDWVNDIHASVNMLKLGTQINNIYLIGIRLGGSIASIYASRHNIDGLLLWCPVIKGNDYLKEIRKNYNMWLCGSFAKLKKIRIDEIFGFPLCKNLEQQIGKIDLLKLKFPSPIKGLILDTEKKECLKLIKWLKKGGNDFQTSKIINKEFWIKHQGENNKSLIPLNEIEIINKWLKTEISNTN